MPGQLLNRGAALVVAKSSRDAYFVTTDAVRITDLRMAFTIARTLQPDPNPATISIYNAAPDTLALLRERPLSISIEAGYDDELELAFVGDLTYAATTTEGPNRVTKIQAGDGARAHRGARVNRSFKAGTDARTAVKEVAASMGLRLPTSLDDVSELSQQFAAGVSLSGPSQAEMTRILGARGMDWSIQNGSLAVYRARDHRHDPPIICTTDAGEQVEGLRILGSPEEGAPTKETKVATVKFRAQLYPRLLPGMRVEVRSRDVQGIYRVERVAHNGDTGGGSDAWATEVEGKAL